MAKKNFYAIRGSVKSEIFTDWDTTKEAIASKTFGKLTYKGFVTQSEAENYLFGDNEFGIYQENLKHQDVLYAYVDGTYNNNRIGFGVAFVKNYDVILEINGLVDDKYSEYQQIGGELKAAMMALNKSKSMNVEKLVIAYDLEGINGWANGWKTNNPLTKLYADFMTSELEKIKTNNPNFILEFVKVTSSHQKNKFNDLADQLALAATL